MALGILSVVYASSQQQVIGMLNNPLEIRLWLSRGMVDLNQRGYGMPYGLFPLESSDAAIMIIAFPSTLLQLAVVIYLCRVWTLPLVLLAREGRSGQHRPPKRFHRLHCGCGMSVCVSICPLHIQPIRRTETNQRIWSRPFGGFCKAGVPVTA
jgi:hypothetical protein